jgi:hypothetical protein
VTGLGIRLYTDEDVDPRVARQLSRHGYDALSCVGAGNHNQNYDDDWQLRFATSPQRVILTHNRGDYIRLDHQWRGSGDRDFGIVLAENTTPIGEPIRRMRRHLDVYEPEEHYDLLLWLE